MRMRWIPFSFALLFLAQTLLCSPASGAGAPGEGSSREPLLIGVSLPLSGPAATYGEDIRNTLEVLRSLDQTPAYQFVFDDDKCDPKEAITVAKKFIDVQRVKFALGLPCSGTVLSTAPLYQRAKIVSLSTGAGATSISKAGDYIFRTRPSDEGAAKILAEFVIKTHKNVAVVAEDAEMPQGLAETFTDSAKKAKVVVHRENFASALPDLTPIIVKLRSKNVDGLVIFVQTEKSLIAFIKAVHSLNWRVPKFGSNLVGSASFLRSVGELAEGMVFSTLPAREDSVSEHGKRIFALIEEHSGPLKSVDYIVPVTHAALYAAKEVLQTSNDARKTLADISIPGLTGIYSFDQNGDLLGMDFVLKQIRNGKAVNLK